MMPAGNRRLSASRRRPLADGQPGIGARPPEHRSMTLPSFAVAPRRMWLIQHASRYRPLLIAAGLVLASSLLVALALNDRRNQALDSGRRLIASFASPSG